MIMFDVTRFAFAGNCTLKILMCTSSYIELIIPQSCARLPEMIVLTIALEPATDPATTVEVTARLSIASVVAPSRS